MRCRRAGLRHATHARNHPPGPASAKRPQAEQATYAARPIRPPPNGLPGPARHEAHTTATGRVPQHPQGRVQENARPSAAFFSQPGTAPPERQQHGDQLAAAEPGPPRNQRHHERAGGGASLARGEQREPADTVGPGVHRRHRGWARAEGKDALMGVLPSGCGMRCLACLLRVAARRSCSALLVCGAALRRIDSCGQARPGVCGAPQRSVSIGAGAARRIR